MASSIFNPHLAHSFHQTPIFISPKKSHPSSTPISSHFSQPQSEYKLVVNGGAKLSGHVNISGSKNSALAVLAGTLCCSGTSKLHNVPNVSDIQTMFRVLRSLGVKIEMCNNDVMIDTNGICSIEPCSEEIEKIRAGFFVAGPLLARFGEAVVSLPGGCDIGARPIDIYVRGFRALGATVELRERKLYAYAKNGKGLVGGRFHLDFPSVGATETLMMAASMADGETVLSNAAQEPEVVDLAGFLTDSGVKIVGAGTATIVITGSKKKLRPSEFTIIPDRIEAGTFMIAAAITRSCLSMSPVIPSHVSSVMDKLLIAGCDIMQRPPNMLEIRGDSLLGFNVRTGPFPQFPTDLQPQTMVLLTMCNGKSIIEESIFEGRMSHARELEKLGARIQVCGNTAVIYGREGGRYLRGSQVIANDLRSGAALVLAGLGAEGVTEIEGVSHIDRGYENLEMKFNRLGANIVRESRTLAPLP
ncbi:hypothetical protein ACHQM5_017819 [Ranunculus cassubicifolius]